MRRLVLELLVIGAIVSGVTVASDAQDPAPQAEKSCWIDVKTGRKVASVPVAGININGHGPTGYEDQLGTGSPQDPGVTIIDAFDPTRARNTRTGQNFRKLKSGSWIDVKTGKAVASVPVAGININGHGPTGFEDQLGTGSPQDPGVTIIDAFDPTRARNTRTGQNFRRVKCGDPERPNNECKRPLSEKGAIACIEALITRVQKAYDARRAELGDRPDFFPCKARLKTIFDGVGVPAESEWVSFWASVCNSWDYASLYYGKHLDSLKGSVTNIKTTHNFKEPDIKYLEDGVAAWFEEEAKLIKLMDDRWEHLKLSGQYQKNWKEAGKRTAAAKSDAERQIAENIERQAYNIDLSYYEVIKRDNASIKAFGDRNIFTEIPRPPNTP